MDDQIPGLDGASGGAEDLELVLETDPPAPESGGDPLDDIQDESVRAEAKKWRAIARRAEKKDEPQPVIEPKAPSQEFLTKADFYKTNERKAVREAIADPEIKAAWKDIAPLYTPRRGRETAEDIAEDIKDAIAVYNSRKVVAETDDSALGLSATPVVKTGGGTSAKVPPKTAEPPNFKLPAQPKDWYPPVKK